MLPTPSAKEAVPDLPASVTTVQLGVGAGLGVVPVGVNDAVGEGVPDDVPLSVPLRVPVGVHEAV